MTVRQALRYNQQISERLKSYRLHAVTFTVAKKTITVRYLDMSQHWELNTLLNNWHVIEEITRETRQ